MMRRFIYKIFLGIFIYLLAIGIFAHFRPGGIGGILKVAFADLNAGTNVTSTYPNYFIWNDAIGWMDWHYTHTVRVSSQRLTGWASSSAGEISLDCATTPIGNICGTSDYYVANDGCGRLSGWGWNDIYGWVSFCGNPGGTNGCASTSVTYGVNIDSNNGDFYGWAWNDIAGWLSFCSTAGEPGAPAGQCSGSTIAYKVTTSWQPTSTIGVLYSSIIDTGVNGAQLNTILWQGDAGTGGSSCGGSSSANVQFQFDAADATSSLSLVGAPYYNAPEPGRTYVLGSNLQGRYIKFAITLTSDLSQQVSPRVDDVILNWSP